MTAHFIAWYRHFYEKWRGKQNVCGQPMDTFKHGFAPNIRFKYINSTF